MCTSIVLIGCSQPSRLAPERAPVVEASLDIRIEDVLVLETQHLKERSDGIVHRATGTKAVRVRLKPGLPFWLKGQFDQGLVRSVEHDGNA